MIVVEVISPSSKSIDSIRKLQGYFRLRSVRRHLMVDTEARAVIDYRHGDDILIGLYHGGTIRLDPPRLSVAVLDMLPPPS